MSVAFDELDHEYRLDAGEGDVPPQTPPMLPPYFGFEGPSRDFGVAQQGRTIRQWIERCSLFAAARREIASRRAAAFAAEGLA